MYEALKNIKADFHTNEEFSDFLAIALRVIVPHLPTEWLKLFEGIRSNRLSPPSVLLRGLPTDDVSNLATPLTGQLSTEKQTRIAELIQLGICQLLGTPMAFRHEREEGGILHLIAPRPGRERTDSSESVWSKLGHHVEHAFSEHLCPAWVTLFCLRPDAERQAVTGMCDIRDVLPYLNTATVTALKKPIYAYRLPDSFGDKKGVSQAMPILGGTATYPRLRYSLERKFYVVSSSADEVNEGYEQYQTLGKLMAHPDLQHEVKLEEGDFLLLNNKTGAHSRSSFDFSESPDNRNRWLHRCIVAADVYGALGTSSDRYNQFL